MSSSQSLDQGQSVQQMVLGNWFCMHRSKNKTLTVHLKQNSKYIKDLTVTWYYQITGENSEDTVIRKDFLEKTLIQAVNMELNKWDYIKLRNCYTAKEILSKVKRQLTE